MTKPTLHAALVAAGITTDHHESDLYFPVSPVAVTILDGYPDHKAIAKRFVSNTDGKAWVDVPFAYEPFWQAKKEATRAAIVAKIAAEEAAPPLPDTKEYAFDCFLSVAIRVPGALSEDDARAMLADNLECADSNFGAWPDGNPFLAEASLAADVMTPRLYEVAGDSVDLGPDTGTLPEALNALRALLAAADREDGYSEDDIDTLIGKARDIVTKHDERGATIVETAIRDAKEA